MPLHAAIAQRAELRDALDEREDLTSGENSSAMLCAFTPASSMVSCRRPAAMAAGSIPASARKKPTSAQWMKYGAPE
jgi:hypothetical protein